ncbi:SDR family oxidoreductase [Pseudonocardia acaciae]
MPKEHLDLQLERIPLGRFSTPRDVTRTYLFLLGDDGSYYTGQTLSPNGGDVMP